jgi:hypothetical protein
VWLRLQPIQTIQAAIRGRIMNILKKALYPLELLTGFMSAVSMFIPDLSFMSIFNFDWIAQMLGFYGKAAAAVADVSHFSDLFRASVAMFYYH